VQVSPGAPFVDVLWAMRSALSRGDSPGAPVIAAASRIEPDPVILDLLSRASALPFGGSRPSTQSNYRWSGLMSSSRLAGLHTLDLIIEHQGDAAAAVLYDRVKQLRAFDGGRSGLDEESKALLVQEISTDMGILIGQTTLSDRRLTDLDGAFAGVFSTDELALFIRRQALSFYGTTSRLSTGPAVLVRPLLRHHLVAYMQTMADAMEATRLPWPDRIRAMETIPERHSVLPEVPRYIWAWRENEVLRNQTMMVGEGLAAVRCARLVIKVEQFRRANDRLPDALSELRLAAGDEVALDPFTGKRLLYARDSEGYVVYSVGRDSRDDGGKLWPEPPPGRLASTLRPPDVGVRVLLSKQPAVDSRVEPEPGPEPTSGRPPRTLRTAA
jgi:hypothetical protein